MTVDVKRIGIWTFSGLWPDDPAETAEAAAELEELGYDTVWLGAAAGDLALPARLLSATRRLAVATGIVNVWLGHADDVIPAYQKVWGDHPGRFLLGLGAGHAANVEPTGQRYERPYSKLVEYLDRLDAAAPPVPVENRALAALGPRVLALAGQRTAGAHPYLTTPEHTSDARAVLGPGPLLAPEQKVVLDTDPERARALARTGIQRYLGLPNYANNLRRLGFTDDDLADGGSDHLVDALVAWGDVDVVADRVRAHRDAGADHVCVQVVAGHRGLPREQWRELAPALTA